MVVMVRRTALHWVAAGVMGVGTFAGVGWAQQESTTGVREEQSTTITREARPEAAGPLQLPAGVKAVEKPSSSGMYRTLARATEDAISKNGFEDLVDRFTSSDRDRL